MKRTTLYLALAVGILATTFITIANAQTKVTIEVKCCPPVQQRDVDIAICLDTSGSMDGLIESAKQKLWSIVNELAKADPKPKLRVALYQYGNDGLNSENGWVQQLCPLTDDLDRIYEELFKLRTNGGTEYVARVVRAATNDLDWTSQKNALKMIVVAGNEPATQDVKFDLRKTCQNSINKGIIINTIFCGNPEQGRRTGWENAANWAEGQYSAIDQDRGTVIIKTPYDKKIIELNVELNATYVGYGKKGEQYKARQTAQDRNAASLNEAASASRVASKSTSLYVNSDWDVVDAVKNKKLDLETVPGAELPKPMQDLKPEQRKEYVDKLAQRRQELQAKIGELNSQRIAYQKVEMQKQGIDEKNSFDANLSKAIQAQGAKKGLNFKE